MQHNDPTLKRCFDKVVEEEQLNRAAVSGKESFVLRGGRLLRVSEEGEQLVVSKPLRSKVLEVAHSIPWAGHLGQQKTLDRLAR